MMMCYLNALQAWSPSSHLTWGCGKHLLECSQKVCQQVLCHCYIGRPLGQRN